MTKNTRDNSNIRATAELIKSYIDALVSPLGTNNAAAAAAYARAVVCVDTSNTARHPAPRQFARASCR